MQKSIRQLLKHDAAGGVLLIIMAIAALILANSPIKTLYSQFLAIPVIFSFGDFEIHKPFLLWVNDGLMALFFFLVGLEIKREMMIGHLRSFQQIVLPGIGAIAGIIVPALCYVALNWDSPKTISGWAIPSATDIAFALGIFSLFGKGLPVTLKLFLLSVAIFDDIGAIVIIALFYSQDLATGSLAIAFTGLFALFLLNRAKVASLAPYIIIGLIVWASVLKSGVHATLAGFVVALFIPLHLKNQHGEKVLSAVEHGLHFWVALLILPLFAFVNAGVELTNITLDTLLNPITIGIALGLFVGKQVGVFGACFLAIKLGWAKLPQDATWLQLYGVSLLCGVGFTMSLFIGSLAFETIDASYLASVKIGVLLGSVLSAVLGGYIIHYSKLIMNKK